MDYRQACRHILLDYRQMSSFCRDPLIFARADGVYYWDMEGKRYIDGISGIFVAVLGHRHPRVLEAMGEQLERFTFAPPLHSVSDRALEYVEALREALPEGLGVVKLLSGGSEATEAAMKLARQYHKQTGNPAKYKVISLYKGYHGATLGALAATGTPKRKKVFEPLPAGFVKVPPPLCARCGFEKAYPECGLFCARFLEQIVQQEGPETVSAVILEPIGNTGGVVVPPEGYLQKVKELCTRYGILLIYDEIITGFGRTGRMFAAQTFGVTPDILCMGKGMGGGYVPLAGIAVSEEVARAFWGPPEAGVEFHHGHTFGANPLAAAVGLAVLAELVEHDLPSRARELGRRLRARLEGLERFGIREVRGRGLLLGVDLGDTDLGVQFGRECLKRGLIVRADPDWFALAPPLISTEAHIDEMAGIVEDAMAAVFG